MAYSASLQYEAIDKVTPILERIARAQEKVEEKAKAAFEKSNTAAAKFEARLKSIGGTIETVGNKMSLYITAPLTALGAMAVYQGAKYQDALNSVQVITGLTQEQMAAFSPDIMKLGETWGIAGTDIAKAMELIGSKQAVLLKTPALLLKVTEAATILSRAAGDELPATANSLLSIMNAFEIKGGDAMKTANMLAASAKEGAATIPYVSSALTKAAAVAYQAKIPIEEMVATIQVLAEKSGQASEEVGTGLLSMLNNLEGQTNKKYKPSVVGLSKAFENLAKMEKNTIFIQDILKKENGKFYPILFRSGQAIKEMKDKIVGTDEAMRGAIVRMQTFNRKADTLYETFKNKLIKAFAEYEPKLSAMVVSTTEMLNKTEDWVKENQKLSEIILSFLAVIALMGPTFKIIGWSMKSLTWLYLPFIVNIHAASAALATGERINFAYIRSLGLMKSAAMGCSVAIAGIGTALVMFQFGTWIGEIDIVKEKIEQLFEVLNKINESKLFQYLKYIPGLKLPSDIISLTGTSKTAAISKDAVTAEKMNRLEDIRNKFRQLQSITDPTKNAVSALFENKPVYNTANYGPRVDRGQLDVNLYMNDPNRAVKSIHSALRGTSDGVNFGYSGQFGGGRQ